MSIPGLLCDSGNVQAGFSEPQHMLAQHLGDLVEPLAPACLANNLVELRIEIDHLPVKAAPEYLIRLTKILFDFGDLSGSNPFQGTPGHQLFDGSARRKKSSTSYSDMSSTM
jgi:hypothetical protein